MRVILYPYKMASQSARLLQEELHMRLLVCRRVSERYRYRLGDLVINWGNTQTILAPRATCLNWLTITNKLSCFNKFSEAGISIPEYTSDKLVAQNWRSAVVVRHILTGSAGRGIEIVEQGHQLPDAPLYTKYVKKSREYRVHVFDGQVIDIEEKRKRRDWEDERDTRIRNLGNGYVFCREGVDAPPDVLTQSIRAVASLGLDFGGVDVCWNNHYNRAYVLEVNTAPGIEGETVIAYADAIEKRIPNG